jgi:hypothetical protein
MLAEQRTICIDPRMIVPLTGVEARSLLPAATPGGSGAANGGERFAFELAPGVKSEPLVYTEKVKEQKLRQGKDAKLVFAAASAKERDMWLADIDVNRISTPTKVPFSALLNDDDDDGTGDVVVSSSSSSSSSAARKKASRASSSKTKSSDAKDAAPSAAAPSPGGASKSKAKSPKK